MRLLILVFLLMPVCVCIGGFIEQQVNEVTSSRTFDLLNNVKDPFINLLLFSRPQLVSYAIRFDSSLNHALVYQIRNQQATHCCIQIIETVDGSFKVSNHALINGKAEAIEARNLNCYIARITE